MKTYEEMADSVFRRIDEYQTRQKKRRRNIIIRTVAGVAFLFLVLAVSLNLFKPILARELPLVGGAFTYIQDKLTYAGLYDNYAYQVGETASNKGIDITLSEVYCDGTYLYVSFVVDGIDFKKDLEKGGYSKFQLQYEGYTYITADNKNLNLTAAGFSAGLEGEYIDENTFVGIDIFRLENNESFPEEFKLNIDMNAIGLQNMNPKMVSGTWGFSVDAYSNEEDVITYEIGVENEGYRFDYVMVSPIMVTLYYTYPPKADSVLPSFEIMSFGSFCEDMGIAGNGELHDSIGIHRIPRMRFGEYIDLYIVDYNNQIPDNYYSEEIVKQYAIIYAHIDLREGGK